MCCRRGMSVLEGPLHGKSAKSDGSMGKTFPGPDFLKRWLPLRVFSGGVQRAALLCCLWFGVTVCSGCNFLESLVLGPSLDTKTVPNGIVGVPYSFKIQAS